MAFSDPQSVTINAVAVSLPRTGSALNEGRFTSSDGNTTMSISHSSGKRNRHVVKLASAAIVADPLVPSMNLPVGYSAHLVIDGPRQGVTADQLQKLAKALVAWSSDANLTSLVGSQV